MTGSTKPELILQPRLLIKRMAAAYCGLSLSVFDQACPVRPTMILDRILRYDRFALDRWLDSIDNNIPQEDLSISEIWDERNLYKGQRP